MLARLLDKLASKLALFSVERRKVDKKSKHT